MVRESEDLDCVTLGKSVNISATIHADKKRIFKLFLQGRVGLMTASLIDNCLCGSFASLHFYVYEC